MILYTISIVYELMIFHINPSVEIDPRRSCHETDIVKEIRTEVLGLSVEDCSEKSQKTCTPSPNCQLKDKGRA